MSIWYYTDAERQQQGPLSTDELKQYFHRQIVGPDTLVWRDGMLHWRALSELAEQLNLLPAAAIHAEPQPPAKAGPPALAPLPGPSLVEAVPAAEIAAAPTSGRAVFNLGSEPSELPPQVLAEVHQRAVQALDNLDSGNPYRPSQAALRSRTPAARHQDVVYAGFWKRVAAAIVDSLIVGVLASLGGEALGTILGDLAGGGKTAIALNVALLSLLLQTLYYAFFHASFNAATPGKMLIGIKVVRSDGQNMSFLRAVARYFATIPSALILCIGYLMAAFTARKQALHDMICDTVVVDKWAFTGKPEMQRHELGTATVVVLGIYFGLILLAVVLVAVLGASIR